MNKNQFGQLYDNYADEVATFLTYYTKDRNELEDLLQEVFLRLWKYRDKIDLKNSFLKTYLLKTARNVALNYLERKKKEILVLGEEYKNVANGDTENHTIAEKELNNDYEKALEKAPQKAKKVYLLNREEGLSYKEIASTLNISTKTVEVHISKVLNILRRELNVG